MLRHPSNSSSGPGPIHPTLPPLPEPPIFDAPYNPYLGSLLSGTNFPPFQGLTQEQIYQAQLGVIESILHEVKKSATGLSLTLMLVFLLMMTTCGLLLLRIRRNRTLALSGDTEAIRKIVLPAFEPLLWLLCGVNLLYLVAYGVMLASNDYLVYLTRVSIEIMYAGKQLNFVLVPIFLQQPSLSMRALSRAVVQALLMSIYTVPIVWVMNSYGVKDRERMYYWVLVASRTPVLLYFTYRFVFPPARASKQTMREFSGYIISMMLLVFTTGETFRQNYVHTATALGWVITVYSTCLPIFVWRVLRADTEHWRGIGKRAVELQAIFRRKNARVDERVSSQGFHVLIEMHRKYIIDFAHLQLYEPISSPVESLGAIVYRGFLHTKKLPVAVKIYTPTEFTEETVAEFSHEAALCGSLVHPNILKFHGLCVCPPNICLVTELCQGSLVDVTQAQHNWIRQGVIPTPRRQQFLINIGYMIDAARAVAYLHSFSPPFVHRDIKPSNFLVDDEGTVKLTDFGASRTLAARSNSGHQHRPTEAATLAKTNIERDIQSSLSSVGRTVLEIPGVVASSVKCTAQYMAPEVIKGRHAGTFIYGEAADVYSLAMTMWDILNPGMTKYQLGSTTSKTKGSFRRGEVGQRDSEIFELVFAGERPVLDHLLHPCLRELIESAWHADPRQRPTAQAVVASLQAIQEEMCATFALELMEELSVQVSTAGKTSSKSTRQRSHTSFAGTQAVEKLRIGDFVESQSEAIRLGSMLMDSGFLHHAKHARGFEYSGSQYFFDEDHILLCQPLIVMDLADESGCASGRGNPQAPVAFSERARQLQRQKLRQDQNSTGSSCHGLIVGGQERVGSHSSHVLMENRCACRKLGQRVETERTTRRQIRRKFKVFSDENLLTARLLTDDQQYHSSTGVDFAAFRDSATRKVGEAA